MSRYIQESIREQESQEDVMSLESLVQDITDSGFQNQLAIEDMERNVMVLESMLQLKDRMKNYSSFEAKDKDLMRMAAEMAIAGTDSTINDVFPSFESIDSWTYAQEGVMDTVEEVITRIGKRIRYIFKETADSYQNFFTFFEGQTSAIMDIKHRLANKDKKSKVYITVTNNKYLHYGKNQSVNNADEYSKEYSKAAKSMTYFLEELYSYQKEFWNPVPRNKGSNAFTSLYIDWFEDLEKFTDKLIRSEQMRVVQTKDKLDYYRSDKLLGESTIFISKPRKNEYDIGDYGSVKSVGMLFDVMIERNNKFEATIFHGSSKIDGFNGDMVNKLCDTTLELIQAYKPFISLEGKITKFFNSIMEWAITGPAYYVLVLAIYRFMLRIIGFLNRCANASVVFSRGMISNFETIAHKVSVKI